VIYPLLYSVIAAKYSENSYSEMLESLSQAERYRSLRECKHRRGQKSMTTQSFSEDPPLKAN
jgi:hypothetical protein